MKNCLVCSKPFRTYEGRNQVTCSLECRSKRWKSEKTFSEANNPNYKGGKTQYSDGYMVIKSLNHPHKDKNGYVREHRLVMEKHLGRFLLPTEHIHHINHIKTDNRIDNLMLFESNSDHISFHHPKGKQVANPW